MDVMSTKIQLSEFKESLIWKDIVNELSMWRVSAEQEMMCIVDDVADSNPSTANVLTHIGDINGRIKAIDYVLCIVDTLINNKKYSVQETEDTDEMEE